MISGFSNDKVNVNIRYINMPRAMTDGFEVSHDTVNVFRIRFNDIFKNEKIMYAVISVLISVFSLIAGYTVYYVYDLYQIDSHPVTISEDFAIGVPTGDVTNSDIDVLLSAAGTTPAAGIPNNFSTPNVQPPTPDGTAGSYIVLPRKGRKIIDVEDSPSNLSDIAVGVADKKVVLNLSEKVRSNPFVPYTNAVGRTPKQSFPEPPATLPSETDAGKVMTTTISGILYDQYSPSAIINIAGSDYLVKKGDTINKFKILNISNSTVTVKLGANVYSAGVGEQINGKLDYNVISNLNNKFGGSSGVDKMIYNSRERL